MCTCIYIYKYVKMCHDMFSCFSTPSLQMQLLLKQNFSLFLNYSIFFKDSKENIDLLDLFYGVNRSFYIHHCTVGENEFL